MSQSADKPIRLVAVQGPTHLLSVLSVLDDLDAESGVEYADVLVIHTLFVQGEIYLRMREVMNLLKSVREWAAIYDLTGFQKQLGAALGRDPEGQVGKLLDFMPYGSVGMIITSRNWQPMNRLLLSAWPEAIRVAYGDGLGVYDAFEQPPHLPFHQARLHVPVDYCARLDQIPWKVVPRERLRGLIERLLGKLDPFESELLKSKQGRLLMLTPSNYTEAGYFTLGDELAACLDTLERAFEPGDRVFVKPHPRERNDQAGKIAARLVETGVQAEALTGLLGALPTEIVVPHLGVEMIVSPGSASSVGSAYLWDTEARIGIREEFLQRILGDNREVFELNMKRQQQIVDALKGWDGKSILWQYPGPDFDRTINDPFQG